MTERQLTTRQRSAYPEALVMAPTEDGFRVYAAADPKKSYLVSGLPEEPHCSCAKFSQSGDPNWQCPHILAVREHFFGGDGRDPEYDTEERRAIQEETQEPREPSRSGEGTSAVLMLLKRSASPDGRIDSLSVEFSCPVAGTSGRVEKKAKQLLALQTAIMKGFLETHSGKTNDRGNGVAEHSGNGEHPVPARLMSIGGMDGRYGRRLFIVVQVNGTTTRLFGNKKQLSEALVSAGYAGFASQVAEGVSLGVPCRVTTKPSDDGRYLNVERVLPPDENGSGR